MQDDAVLARVVNLLDSQRGNAAGALVTLDKHVQIRVAGRIPRDDNDRLVAEEVADLAYAACSPQELVLVAVPDRVAEVARDRVREVMEVRDQLVKALTPAEVDDVSHDRPIHQRDHRL